MNDRKFLFTEIKRQVELLFKKHNIFNGVTFIERLEKQYESPFNMAISTDSEIHRILSEEFPEGNDLNIKTELEKIFEKYELFSQLDNNILYLQNF